MNQNSKTAKMVLGQYYCVLNSRLALTRLAILNTWNKSTKTKVASRNNVVHQSVLTPLILQWMPMPMVERHIQACLIFCLSACARAVAWRHSDNDVSRPAADYSLPVTSPAAQRWQGVSNKKL